MQAQLQDTLASSLAFTSWPHPSPSLKRNSVAAPEEPRTEKQFSKAMIPNPGSTLESQQGHS